MSSDVTPPQVKLGTPLASGPRTWVQTERTAHEAWGRLTMKSPRAAAVMHRLVAAMDHQNAVVVSQKTLAKMTGCSVETVKRALKELHSERWIDIVRLNGPGTVAAYVVNSAVAWGERRNLIGVLSVFHATVIADADDQPEGALGRTDLRRVPVIYPPEEALPAGDGERGAQIALPGLEPVIKGHRLVQSVAKDVTAVTARIADAAPQKAVFEFVDDDVFVVLSDGTRLCVATRATESPSDPAGA
jgi:Crp-like helix-turn-helix protein